MLVNSIPNLKEGENTNSNMEPKKRSNAKVMYARKSVDSDSVRPKELQGGEKMTEQLAIRLRCLLFGHALNPGHSEMEFASQAFVFESEEREHSWRLKVPSGPSQAVVVCVQAYILKHILFVNKAGTFNPADYVSKLSVSRSTQETSLVNAIADILLKAASESRKPVLCVTQEEILFANTQKFIGDGATEHLVMFSFERRDELEYHIRKYITEFSGGSSTKVNGRGVILLMYSAILSRGIDRVVLDVKSTPPQPLVTSVFPNPALSGLLITGVCSPYRHNGGVYIGGKEEVVRTVQRSAPKRRAIHSTTTQPLTATGIEPMTVTDIIGVTSRSDIGFLWWTEELELEKARKSKILPSFHTLSCASKKLQFAANTAKSEKYGNEETEEKPKEDLPEVDHSLEAKKLGVGSRLKTPLYPVWVTLCKDVYGLLFNPNKELTRDYHAENRFELLYISFGASEEKSYSTMKSDRQTGAKRPTLLTLDTRIPQSNHCDEDTHFGAMRSNYETKTRWPPLTSLLHTKWLDADVNWNGDAPHF